MEQNVYLTWRCKSVPIFRAQMQQQIKYDFQIIFHCVIEEERQKLVYDRVEINEADDKEYP